MPSAARIVLACLLATCHAGATEKNRSKANPDAPPIRIRAGLFDPTQPKTLGLKQLPGEHSLIYRATPESYQFCHHPNVAVWRGKLFLMWSNGITHEDYNGQRILWATTDDGHTWSKPAVLTEDPDGAGPLACVAAGWHATEQTLIAYYTAIVEKRPGTDERNRLYCLTSRDGQTWSERRALAHGFFIEGPRQIAGGRLLMNGQRSNQQPRLRFSDALDGIRGWQDGRIPEIQGVFSFPEPSWFTRRDGSLVMTFRTKSGDPTIYASVSRDRGSSWSQPRKTHFPDATARSFAGTLPDGQAFLISNPNTVPSVTHPSIGRRNPLTISLSADGRLFDRAYIIRGPPTSMRFKGINKANGWQYPSAVAWQKHLYVAYSINKEDLGVTRIALGDLIDRSAK